MSHRMGSDVTVACAVEHGGWRCGVTVSDERGSREFQVAVSRTELEHFDPGADDPTALVGRSFDFLLEREPKESILKRFSLSKILEYFPEYEREIRSKPRG